MYTPMCICMGGCVLMHVCVSLITKEGTTLIVPIKGRWDIDLVCSMCDVAADWYCSHLDLSPIL